MMPLRTSVLLGSLTGTGAVLGGLFGATVGWLAPGYYRTVFRNGMDPGFDPVQTGMGLGVGQGAAVGLAAGLLLLAAVAWKAKAAADEASFDASSDSPDGGHSPVVRVSFGTGALLTLSGLAMVVVAFVAFLAGGIAVQTDNYTRRAEHEMRLVRERVREHAAFAKVVIRESSDGHVMLGGEVESQRDHDQLREELQDLFGTQRAAELAVLVEVVSPNGPKSNHENRTLDHTR